MTCPTRGFRGPTSPPHFATLAPPPLAPTPLRGDVRGLAGRVSADLRTGQSDPPQVPPVDPPRRRGAGRAQGGPRRLPPANRGREESLNRPAWERSRNCCGS